MAAALKVEVRTYKNHNAYEVVTSCITPGLASALIIRAALEKSVPDILNVSSGKFSVDEGVSVVIMPACPADLMHYQLPPKEQANG